MMSNANTLKYMRCTGGTGIETAENKMVFRIKKRGDIEYLLCFYIA